MSKIGKKPITIPPGVEVTLNDGSISVKGPKGTLTKELPQNVTITIAGQTLKVKPTDAGVRDRGVFWGLARALIQNMVKGVSEGFETVLEFQGVGYKATVKGNDLELGLGFSHPVNVSGAEGVTFKADKSSIRIQGIDKELIGKIAANIRSYRPPEPYKGSGIRYAGEIIKRKAGKKAVAAG